MASYWERIVTTLTTAREAWRRSAHEAEGTFSDVDNRRERYTFYWQYYANDLYDDLAAHKGRYGLYRHIRPLYNPVKRLVNFYVAKVWGGQLDYDTLAGAIPIECDNDDIRPALAQLWQWSNWQAKKQLAIRWGACLGDMVLKVVDDFGGKNGEGKVYLQVMHPRTIKDAQFDHRGNVTSCVIEYVDSEPHETQQGVYVDFTYKEVITKERFATFKNDEPFDYFEDGRGAEWVNPYGFVPLVIGVHEDVGLDWGDCCFAHKVELIDELNDQASVFSDRMRKANNLKWLFAGVSEPRGGAIDLSDDDATTTDQYRRQTTNVFYADDPSAKPHALISALGLAESLDNIELMLAEMEREFPELAIARLREKGQTPRTESLEILYQDVVDRVTEARGNYDGALVRAQQMALSIGGYRRYENFEPFGLGSYAAGDEEHRIGHRSVLAEAQHGKIEAAIKAGVPPGKRLWGKLGLGWTEEELDDMEAEAFGDQGVPFEPEREGEDGDD